VRHTQQPAKPTVQKPKPRPEQVYPELSPAQGQALELERQSQRRQQRDKSQKP
jgi:hypothetical protein